MFWKRRLGISATLFFLAANVACPQQARAQAMGQAQNALDYTLSSLQDSVAKLKEENKKLSLASDSLRTKIRVLNDQLKALQKDEEGLLRQSAALDARDQKKHDAIDQLRNKLTHSEQVLAEVRNEELKAQADSTEGEASNLQVREEALKNEIAGIRAATGSMKDPQARLIALQQERQGLESELQVATRQALYIKGEWQSLSVAVNSGAGQAKIFEKEQAQLKDDMSRSQGRMESLRQAALKQDKIVTDFSNEATAAELLTKLQSDVDGLDSELEVLKKEVAALNGDLAVSGKDVKEDAQRKKKEETFKDLSLRNAFLRAELSRMQMEMVRLDKKKAAIEKVLYQPRY